MFKNKSNDPLIANFQDIDHQEIENSKEVVIKGVQISSDGIVFFTNALIEELYLRILPEYFSELLKASPQKSLKDLSGTE